MSPSSALVFLQPSLNRLFCLTSRPPVSSLPNGWQLPLRFLYMGLLVTPAVSRQVAFFPRQ